MEMETDENENVGGVARNDNSLLIIAQGIDGPVVYTGSTPDLDDFTLRIIDGLHLILAQSSPLTILVGPDNNVPLSGSQASAFVDRIGKTHVAGFRVPSGQVWQAKGVYLSFYHCKRD
jgi:mannosyl-oligosaccharide glucosidase